MRQSVNIGTWCNYASYTNAEQRKLQRDSLTELPVDTRRDIPLNFIFTNVLDNLNAYAEVQLRALPIVNIETTLINEVFYTTKIEGAKTTRLRTSEIHNGTRLPADYSERMVYNCFNTTRYLNAAGNKITEKILITAWKLLTKDACDNMSLGTDGYRISDNIVIGSHQPPHYGDLSDLMLKLITFYNSSDLDDIPIIKACIIHYVFEVIHPFCDGNGRMGRLLMSNYLISRGFNAARAVSFSMYIDKNRGAYDAAFVKSENIYNDCTPFVQYMLEDVICPALEEAISKGG